MIADKQLEKDFIQSVLSCGENSPGRLNAELVHLAVDRSFFTEDGYYELYQAVRTLAQSGSFVSESSIKSVLDLPEGRKKALFAGTSLWPLIPNQASIGALFPKLHTISVRRNAYSIGRKIIEAAEKGSDGLQEGLIEAASSLNSAFSSSGSGIENGHEVLHRFYDELERAQSGESSGIVPTGISGFDDCVGGIPRNFLSIVGAYPGCFKSGIMATIAANVAKRGTKVGIFSLEDNPVWVAKRYVSRATGIPVEEIGRRKLTEAERNKVAETQDSVAKVTGNIYLDGRSDLTGYDVAASARFMAHHYKCELILIDHIGEIQAKYKRRDRYDLEIAEGVRMVRNVAKDCGIAVLMAAHLRRRGDTEDEDIYRIPRMTDFSDSSAIEKMSRLALGLYQPRDNPEEVALRVLKCNEMGARGSEFRLTKDAKSALVRN